jgi:dTDP-4-dehydrorhamnose 3,5-epimerase
MKGYKRAFATPDPNAKREPLHTVSSDPLQYDLTWHLDARGGLVELFRGSWTLGYCEEPCRQVYISATSPGVVKAWHMHEKQTDRFILVRGRLLVVLCRDGAPPKEYVLDANKTPRLLVVPPFTAHGWMALGNEEAWVLNLVSEEYTGMDEMRRPPHEGPWPDVAYVWRRNRDG